MTVRRLVRLRQGLLVGLRCLHPSRLDRSSSIFPSFKRRIRRSFLLRSLLLGRLVGLDLSLTNHPGRVVNVVSFLGANEGRMKFLYELAARFAPAAAGVLVSAGVSTDHAETIAIGAMLGVLSLGELLYARFIAPTAMRSLKSDFRSEGPLE